MRIDLVGDFRRVMEGVIPTRSARERVAFAKLDVHEQAWRFLNWQSRLVHPHARRIYRANGFEITSNISSRQKEANLVLGRLAAGVDVTEHLSSKIYNGYCIHTEAKNGDDFDLLLNEWGIHHFHLPSIEAGKNRGGRSKELLFAIILPGEVFAIAVGTHADWAAPQLIRNAIQSWPHRHFFSEIKGVMLERHHTPNERKTLRKAGVASLDAVENAVYLPRLALGLTTALVSMSVAREASRVLSAIRHRSEDPEQIVVRLKQEAKHQEKRWPKNPKIGVTRVSTQTQWRFAFTESTAGVYVLI